MNEWDKGLTNALFLTSVRASGEKLGIRILNHEAGTVEAITSAFAAMQREGAQALMVQVSPFMNTHTQRIVDLAAQRRLPAMYQTSGWMDAGGLIYYGISTQEMHRHAATYVDRILKGAKPGDLPVEQPTKYELVINLKAAKALGLKIPQSVLIRADRVIE